MKTLPMILTFLLAATTSPAQHYLPLSTGNFWTSAWTTARWKRASWGSRSSSTGARPTPSSTW
jgi:hypothetical protein